MNLRWEDYFFTKNKECRDFWKNYLKKNRDILFILGKGFDPRMCLGLEELILQNEGLGKRDCVLISFAEEDDSLHEDLRRDVKDNNTKLNKLMNGKGSIRKKSIRMENDDGNIIGPREAAKLFKDYSDFEKYTDIIIDISSLPLNIYFPLIGKILSILDSNPAGKRVSNLHVLVTENVLIDGSIQKSGLVDDARYLFGFTGNLGTVSREENPTVWIPVLGEGHKEQIKRIENLVSPKEICPVLPSPSTDPKRGDKIMLEYRDLLIDDMLIETKNIVYGSEQNPFELYRQIYQTINHYRDALKPLKDPKFAISPLSSKLMSMGSFLVAYGRDPEENIGIAYVESKEYSMESRAKNQDILKLCEPFSLWIFGDCYNV